MIDSLHQPWQITYTSNSKKIFNLLIFKNNKIILGFEMFNLTNLFLLFSTLFFRMMEVSTRTLAKNVDLLDWKPHFAIEFNSMKETWRFQSKHGVNFGFGVRKQWMLSKK